MTAEQLSAASTPRERLAVLLGTSSVTSDQLAAAMLLEPGVSVDDVLSGSHEPTVSELVGAAEVLRIPVEMLTGQLELSGHLGVSLRLGIVEEGESLAAPLAFANVMLEARALLNSWLDRVHSPLQNFPVSNDHHAKSAGRITAERVRAALSLYADPLPDMVELIEALDIPVALRELPAGVHGLNARDLRDRAQTAAARVIVVSTSDAWTRQRYTLAHELCHALYDDEGLVIVDKAEVSDRRLEIRAESFASNLLLPRSALRRAIGARGSKTWDRVVAEIMITYGISRQATVIALETDGGVPSADLEHVRTARVDALMEAAGLTEQWNQVSDQVGGPSGSPMLIRRAAEAYSNGWVTSDLIARLMDQSVLQTEADLNLAGWTPEDVQD